MEKNYKLKEVSKILDVSVSSLRLWIRVGKIKSIRVGTSVRITQSELDRFVK